ncbi:hypothetical protein DGG96_20050 [Legionella qingyii]|uniref:Leucine-rich repeat-containing protein n=1 Tax=Legionella qingyii TaxID=2184757 RepID=A0A317U077_9GAMM|nr:hypothetical protein [Legionella qingyii]PWY53872.1 hypothetical protein DGG96_20050 [Legionella qingyii]RUR21144.1 hypothetical protein ELY20_13605 [Legionella qingyii]RUR22114.1 hypothetical protein ELY16_15445 [Legionella qingyii]
MLYFNASTGETVLSGLTNVNGDMLMRSIFKINKNTKHIDMGWNNFGKRSNFELQVALSHLNDQIKFVTLRGNSLGKKSGEDAALVFLSLKHATHVDLSFNDLNVQKRLDIGLKGFVSTQVTSLDLSSNNLGIDINKQLNKAVAVLIGLKSLNMSYNKLDRKSEEELETLCAAFPANLEHLDLSNNNLGSKINLIRKLPKNITSLNISDNDIGQLAVEEIYNLKSSLTHLQTLYISIDELTKMSPKQKKAWESILSPINKVVFLDSSEREVIPEQSLFATNKSGFFIRNYDNKEQDIVESLKGFAKSITDSLRK